MLNLKLEKKDMKRNIILLYAIAFTTLILISRFYRCCYFNWNSA